MRKALRAEDIYIHCFSFENTITGVGVVYQMGGVVAKPLQLSLMKY
jgi:hypothetical protein